MNTYEVQLTLYKYMKTNVQMCAVQHEGERKRNISVDEAGMNKVMGIGYEKRYNVLSSSPYVMF